MNKQLSELTIQELVNAEADLTLQILNINLNLVRAELNKRNQPAVAKPAKK